MKNFCRLCLLALLASSAQAEPGDCLADLAGIYTRAYQQIPSELLARQNQDGWQFSLPEESDADAARERLFRDRFDHKPELEARVLDAATLLRVGAIMFSPYTDKTARLDGLRVECGLAADNIFLIRVDLSQVPARLINNMLMLNIALYKQPRKNFSDDEIAIARQLKYFVGEYFALEGVTSGILAFPMQKAPVRTAPAKP